ncbi:MAG: CBS domain-containing protein, partial [Planctomycetia bacterium]|jgi:predicted transcriptional regulator
MPAVQQTATFEEVVTFIDHSHDNIYAVVNQANELTGIIRYRELGNVLFDPSVSSLIRAADIAVPPSRLLFPDNTATDAFSMFSITKDDSIPVVTREEPHILLGMLRRRDLMRQHLRSQS